jgi:hypothetical protein
MFQQLLTDLWADLSDSLSFGGGKVEFKTGRNLKVGR